MTSKEFHTRLARRAKRAGVAVGRDLAGALWSYFDLLSRWNRKINLTSLEQPDEAIDRLLLEPLIAARYLPRPDASLLDVGSGGGSPAVPLKLAAPSLSLWMVEAKVRKSAFLREVVRQLSLSDVRVENARYEELLARPELHEAMDVVTVRAVRTEPRTLMRLQAFLAPGGLVFLFRAASGPDEPAGLTPPLVWQASHPLVDSLGSRLVILAKVPVGH